MSEIPNEAGAAAQPTAPILSVNDLSDSDAKPEAFPAVPQQPQPVVITASPPGIKVFTVNDLSTDSPSFGAVANSSTASADAAAVISEKNSSTRGSRHPEPMSHTHRDPSHIFSTRDTNPPPLPKVPRPVLGPYLPPPQRRSSAGTTSRSTSSPRSLRRQSAAAPARPESHRSSFGSVKSGRPHLSDATPDILGAGYAQLYTLGNGEGNSTVWKSCGIEGPVELGYHPAIHLHVLEVRDNDTGRALLTRRIDNFADLGFRLLSPHFFCIRALLGTRATWVGFSVANSRNPTHPAAAKPSRLIAVLQTLVTRFVADPRLFRAAVGSGPAVTTAPTTEATRRGRTRSHSAGPSFTRRSHSASENQLTTQTGASSHGARPSQPPAVPTPPSSVLFHSRQAAAQGQAGSLVQPKRKVPASTIALLEIETPLRVKHRAETAVTQHVELNSKARENRAQNSLALNIADRVPRNWRLPEAPFMGAVVSDRRESVRSR
eukprot:TRINITY_DN6909_c0_g1_i2.p1 TRINITY_DN6909_c0_g1~~TRINITY_DN6909_c0_g1_i2.p1  ORF type:complete len:490 (-),score=32.54 TRINITY_DN6909_c0_g1_i2:32-1501(-)